MKRSRVPRDYFDDDDDEDFEMVARAALPSATSRPQTEQPAAAEEEEDPLEAFMRMNARQVSEESQRTRSLPEIVSSEEVLEKEEEEALLGAAGRDVDDLDLDEQQVCG